MRALLFATSLLALGCEEEASQLLGTPPPPTCAGAKRAYRVSSGLISGSAQPFEVVGPPISDGQRVIFNAPGRGSAPAPVADRLRLGSAGIGAEL